jgi:hypothetical protein
MQEWMTAINQNDAPLDSVQSFSADHDGCT